MNIFRRCFSVLRVGFHLLGEVLQIMYGLYKVMKLRQPTVSIFGASRLKLPNSYLEQAGTLSRMLVTRGVSVLTGGGPGVMKAANCGAMPKDKPTKPATTMGIGISGLPHEEGIGINVCAGEYIVLDYFFARKWLLINYSIGFIVFPGGFGTFDELSDLLNLLQTGKRFSAPVVLIGVDFWRPYLELLANSRKLGLLSAINEPRIIITDDLVYAVKVVAEHCTTCDV